MKSGDLDHYFAIYDVWIDTQTYLYPINVIPEQGTHDGYAHFIKTRVHRLIDKTIITLQSSKKVLISSGSFGYNLYSRNSRHLLTAIIHCDLLITSDQCMDKTEQKVGIIHLRKSMVSHFYFEVSTNDVQGKNQTMFIRKNKDMLLKAYSHF